MVPDKLPVPERCHSTAWFLNEISTSALRSRFSAEVLKSPSAFRTVCDCFCVWGSNGSFPRAVRHRQIWRRKVFFFLLARPLMLIYTLIHICCVWQQGFVFQKTINVYWLICVWACVIIVLAVLCVCVCVGGVHACVCVCVRIISGFSLFAVSGLRANGADCIWGWVCD